VGYYDVTWKELGTMDSAAMHSLASTKLIKRLYALAFKPPFDTFRSNLERIRLLRIMRRLNADFLVTNWAYVGYLGNPRELISTFNALRKHGVRILLWSTEDPMFPPNWFDYTATFDWVFTKSLGSLQIYKERGLTNVSWLPLATDSSVFKPKDIAKDKDLCFIGSYQPHRFFGNMEILNPLFKAYGKRFHIYGPGWSEINWASTARIRGPVLWSDIPRIVSQSRISVNVHVDADRETLCSPNMRVFETLACRGFMLCDDFKGYDLLFQDRKEIAVIRNSQEALELVSYYLEREDEREKIAEAGYKKVLSQHTIANRANQILKILQKL